jgi:hypothetical protein
VEILKNFMVGILVIFMGLALLVVSVLLFPILLVAGSLLLISIKAVIFIAFIFVLITAIGYAARKIINKNP